MKRSWSWTSCYSQRRFLLQVFSSGWGVKVTLSRTSLQIKAAGLWASRRSWVSSGGWRQSVSSMMMSVRRTLRFPVLCRGNNRNKIIHYHHQDLLYLYFIMTVTTNTKDGVDLYLNDQGLSDLHHGDETSGSRRVSFSLTVCLWKFKRRCSVEICSLQWSCRAGTGLTQTGS